MKIFYSVHNLRSLEDTPFIEIRPITILVGRNSAGKSTFLRSFSLLRQSLEARSSAPILWYGEYADFGDFRNAVSHSDIKREISFSFRLEDLHTGPADDDYFGPLENYQYQTYSRRKIYYQSIMLSVSLGESDGRTIRRGVNLSVPNNHIDLKLMFSKSTRTAEDFQINGRNIEELLPQCTIYFNPNNMFSPPILVTTAKSDARAAPTVLPPVQTISARISDLIGPQVDKRISKENLLHESTKILRFNKLDTTELKELALNSDTQSLKKVYERWTQLKDHTFYLVNDLCSLNASLIALARIGDVLREFFISTTYLGPARARSERYYRFQELEVSEIASDGQNLPVFLASLSESELDGFSNWVEKLFGFGVAVRRDAGHISIQLRKSNFSVNVADTGYGVSQMLPVLAQIWWASRPPMRRRTYVSTTPLRPITMEQPELHLHPAHQARLADALLRALEGKASHKGAPPLFVVETHSEALINRLGELIESGDLSADDVQVIIFSASESDSNSTSVRTSKFDASGALVDWPFGFFNF